MRRTLLLCTAALAVSGCAGLRLCSVRRQTLRRDLRRRAARVPDGLCGLGLCALR